MTPVFFPAVFTLAYMLYLFSDRTSLLRRLAVRLGDPDKSWEGSESGAGREWLVFLQKALGFLLMGFLPFVLLIIYEGGVLRAAMASGLALPQGPDVWVWTLLPLVLVMAVAALRSGRNIPTDFYPQVRRRDWPLRRVILNAVFWSKYLLGYEYAFRGYLLFPIIAELGVNGAITLNASVYALAHIYKGPSEAFGAFFLGILFCAIAIGTSSFVVPAVMHIIMAVGNDMTAVSRNPEMRFVHRT